MDQDSESDLSGNLHKMVVWVQAGKLVLIGAGVPPPFQSGCKPEAWEGARAHPNRLNICQLLKRIRQGSIGHCMQKVALCFGHISQSVKSVVLTRTDEQYIGKFKRLAPQKLRIAVLYREESSTFAVL
eukprot:1156649-Pelagomonas_calceolata.AAC.6